MPALAGLDVSRETIDNLEEFGELLLKWNKSINLIAKSTVPDIWDRHICDSAQLINMAPEGVNNWLDVGSGGGLPGIVVATILKEQQPNAVVTMVESDQRKATFLRTAVRVLNLNSKVIAERAENVLPAGTDVLSARALMPLSGLCKLAERHLQPNGKMIVLKGRTSQEEVDEARKSWHFDVVAHTSLTDNEAKVLEIGKLKRVST